MQDTQNPLISTSDLAQATNGYAIWSIQGYFASVLVSNTLDATRVLNVLMSPANQYVDYVLSDTDLEFLESHALDVQAEAEGQSWADAHEGYPEGGRYF